MTHIEEMKQGLGALEVEDMACRYEKEPTPEYIAKAIASLRQAIAEADQEPVPNVVIRDGLPTLLKNSDIRDTDLRLVIHPPQPCPYVRSTREGTHHCALAHREWVGLTEDDTDRELLELAAKACKLPECGWMGPAFMYVKDNTFADWNPLEDDGDALRLAVKLDMLIAIHGESNYVRVYAGSGAGVDDFYGTAAFENDPCAATRRAIVRAAAEIGKAMP